MRATLWRLALGWLLGAGSVRPVFSQFVDRAQAAGLNVSVPTSPGGHAVAGLDAYAVGGAAAACDLDGDGWTDLIVARPGAPCLVFINNRDGTFREEARARGLDTVSDIGGIAVGDLQNRGVPDVVMVPVVGPRYFLFVNDGTGHFTERAEERGAAVPVTVELHRGQSVSLVDYDRDGFLDIHVSEWSVLSNPDNARHSVLLRNQGRAQPGYFENRTAAAGLVQPVEKNVIAGYATAWADFDGDGFPDLFIAGDFGTSQLWWNNGDGTFTNGTVASGIANPADGMGIAVLDYDGDGRLDIFVSAISLTNPSSTTDKGYVSDNKLFRNLGNRRFVESARSEGVRESGWGWGVGLLDANNDGWPDLLVTNGYVAAGANFAAGRTDPTRIFLNRRGTFSEESAAQGIIDTGLGRSVVVLDYDNDGRQDVFITQTAGPRILYRNETPAGSAHWLDLRLVGTISNRDGYGCEVTITAGGRRQTAWYNPTNAYIGQHEPRLHLGLGAATVVERLSIKWPSGLVQEMTELAVDRALTVVETGAGGAPPAFMTQPRGGSVDKDAPLVLTALAAGTPAPSYSWFKDGVRLAGQTAATLRIGATQPIDAGIYTVTATNVYGSVSSEAAAVTVGANLGAKSVARWWNEALLDGIRRDVPNPPVHARNLFHLAAALWDSYWAYERDGWAAQHEVLHREVVGLPADEPTRLAAQREAMSHAAFTVLNRRFAGSVGRAATIAGGQWLMRQFGYDPNFDDATEASARAAGLRIGRRILALTVDDGANEAGAYVNVSGYVPANPPLVVRESGVGLRVDPDRWQPLDLVNTVTQNGITLGPGAQSFVGANARATQAFALTRGAGGTLAVDPGPPPRFGQSDYRRQAVEVLNFSAQLSPADGVDVDISPGSMGNNPLGTNDGRGHPTNPFTGRPYAANPVARGNYARLLAEYWADGPASETPPGHWNVLFNEVSDHPASTRRFLGDGPRFDRLRWDVCGYLALNAALHDAACAAWTLKWQYDSARPITMIRYLAELGQSSDPNQPRYHPQGLPLVPGQIELVTAASAAPGQRHAHLATRVGGIAVRSWLGTPADPTSASGVGWIMAVDWLPYQRDTFVTPAFPAYVSGHSTFSRAAAEVLTRLTGSAFFPGGLSTRDFPAETSLAFEAGPSRAVQLQWATYYDAADQAGLSRLYGGIHIAADDLMGRRIGARVGADAFERFLLYLGSASVAGDLARRAAVPAIVTAPAPIVTAVGSTARLAVEASGAGPMSYQWLRGSTVVGSGRILELPDVSVADSGGYQVVVRNAAGSVRSETVRLVVGASSSLANLSIRAQAGQGERALIAGFVVRGAGAKTMLVRGVGPALASLGVADAVAAPELALVDGGGRLLGRNQRWDAAATPSELFARVGAFPLREGSADAALQLVLPPGGYTATLADRAGRTGSGLIEIYDADSTSDRLINLSARASVGPGANLAIAGFVVRGGGTGRYLVRGIGPALGQFGVAGALPEPVLTVATGAGRVMATGRGWAAGPNPAEIAAANSLVGAFPLPASARDAALLLELEPGVYTAQLSSGGDVGGIGLLEIFELP